MSRKKRMQNIREAKDRRTKKIAVGGGGVRGRARLRGAAHARRRQQGGGPGFDHGDHDGTHSRRARLRPPAANDDAPGDRGSGPADDGEHQAPELRPRAEARQVAALLLHPFLRQGPVRPADLLGQQLPTPTSSGTSTPPPTVQQTASVRSRSAQQGRRSRRRTLAKTGAATISVNGRRETVRIGAGFPSSNPLFRLISVSHGVARIGVANGSYASGAQTVSLVTGRTLTLVDTADGIHYKVRLAA